MNDSSGETCAAGPPVPGAAGPPVPRPVSSIPSLPDRTPPLPGGSRIQGHPECLAHQISSTSTDPPFECTCSNVHCFGALSGRQRTKRVPWRKRPPLK